MLVRSTTANLRAGLLVLAIAVYAAGVAGSYLFLCQPGPAWMMMAGVAAMGAAGLLALPSAFRTHSFMRGATAAGILLLAAGMFLFVGVLTLPGCSGV
jgi:hypothetical protein